MNVLTPLAGFDINLSSAPQSPTMLRLHFTNWSNTDYENNPEDLPESKEELDRFIIAMKEIRKEIEEIRQDKYDIENNVLKN